MFWRSSEKASTAPASQPSAPVTSSSWRELIKSLSSFRGDLSSMTAPPFILAPASLLEYCHFWYAGHDEIRRPARVPASDQEQRFLEVVRMFVHIMKGQYTKRSVKDGFEKKPLNPFLGELFVGRVEGDLLRAEQVSHHPPGYAYKLTLNKDDPASAGLPEIEQEGFVLINARFSTTVTVEQLGRSVYKLGDGESYTVTLPPLHLEGFIYGSPFIEVDKSSEIRSSESGYTCTFQYSGAGWVSGQSHTLKGEIRNKAGELLYTLSGFWNTLVEIKNEKTGETSEFVKHAADSETVQPTVVPVADQHELESQRAWQKVAEAIRANDNEAVRVHKTALEDAQRQLRKDEAADGRTWQHRWFTKSDGPDGKPQWVFDEDAYAKDSFFAER